MAQTRAIVDKLLTNVSSAYVPEGYVSEMALPKVSSKQSSGKLGKYGDQHLRLESTIMGGRGEARRVETITRSTESYFIERHGLEGLVTEDDRNNVEDPFDAERDEVIGLSTHLWLAKEKALADALTSTSILTQNVTLSGTSQLSDYTNSDPIGVFKDARKAVRDGSGLPPDTAIMDWNVANTLSYHPGVLESLGFTQNRAGQLSDQELAKAMGVKRLLIAMPQYNSANEGQSSSRTAVWGNDIVFGVMPQGAQRYQVSLGYYMVLSSVKPRQVTKQAVVNPPRATSIIVEDAYDMFLSNVNAGYLVKDAIA